MFRRSSSTTASAPTGTSTTTTEGPRARHSRRTQQREAAETAALAARLDRVQRRLAEVGSVRSPLRPEVIDTEAARQDPLTRPFAATDRDVTSLPGSARQARGTERPIDRTAARRRRGTEVRTSAAAFARPA